MIRLAAFSDVHGNIAALEAVLADIQNRQVEHVLCLGDLVAEGPQPRQVIERVRQLACPVVQGNTDAWFQDPLPSDWRPPNQAQVIIYDCYLWLREQLTGEDHAYLLSLPFDHRFGPVLGVHGSPRSSREAVLPTLSDKELRRMLDHVDEEVSLVVCGHSHVPLLRQIGSRTVVGVGSVAMCTDGDWRPCYALIEQSPSGWHVEWPRVPYDVQAALAAARCSGLPHLDAIGEAWRSGRGLGR